VEENFCEIGYVDMMLHGKVGLTGVATTLFGASAWVYEKNQATKMSNVLTAKVLSANSIFI